MRHRHSLGDWQCLASVTAPGAGEAVERDGTHVHCRRRRARGHPPGRHLASSRVRSPAGCVPQAAALLWEACPQGQEQEWPQTLVSGTLG